MSNVTFTVGEPTYNWNLLYQTALDLGVLNITDNSPQTALTLTAGGTQVIIQGTGLQADGARHLTAGAITGFVVISGGQEVVRIDGLATPASFSDLQTILTEFDNPAPDFTVISNAIAAMLLMEPFNITGSNDRDVIGTTIVGGDVGNLNGGNDAYIVDVPLAAVTIDGGAGRDYLQIGSMRTTGVMLDFGLGQVSDISNGTIFAHFTNFEDGRGSQFDDWIQVSDNPDDSFFIEASLGNDSYDVNGDSYVRVSYRFFQQLTGIAGGINANLATGIVTKAGAGGVDQVWNVDTIQGTSFADTFYGRVWDDEFEGMDGADSFNGSGGNDRVNYSAELGARGVFVNLSNTSNVGTISGATNVNVAAHTALDRYGNTDTLISIEDIIGTDLNDRLIGDSKNNAFWGEAGIDRLYGNGGSDELHGGDGNDFLYGGDGGDGLFGGTGNDTINGEEGDDHINGGEGTDTISAGGGSFDNIAGSGGNDTIDGNAGYDMYAFDEFEHGEDANGDGNPGGQNEHAGDTITVTLQNGVGAGTITGFFGYNSTKPAPTRLAVNQTFVNLERIRGTEGNDSFIVGTGFTNTEDASTVSGDPRYPEIGVFEVVGGKGNDTFTDTAGTRLMFVNYGEEQWSHPDFDDDNGYRWGDGGEPGVAINLSATSKTIDGFGVVQAGKARDTWSNTDTIAGVLAFRLTDTDDVVFAGDAGVFVQAEEGDDAFTGGLGIDTFNGGRGNDTAIGGGGNDRLGGQDGNDVLSGGNGHDQLNGGSGNDTLSGDNGLDQLNGDDGDDILSGGAGRDNVSGGSGNDTAHGDAGNDELYGESGDDFLYGDDGDDEVRGDDGNDTVEGNAGNDRMGGGSGNDTVIGGLGDDRIDGDDDDDIIYGDDIASTDVLGGNDRINGGQGADTIHAGYGHDQIDGGNGADIIHAGFGDDNVNAGSDNDTIHGQDGEDDIYGDFGDDTIDGGNGDDAINGAEGGDTLLGGAGNDDIYGGDGNYDDTIEGGTGNDILGGGLGNDTYILGNEAEGVDQIWEMGGTDLVTSTITRSIAGWDQIENLNLLGNAVADGTGNNGNNVITGNSAANILAGKDGDDTLLGQGGTDTLNGGSGNDTLVGGLLRDVLTGGDGDDSFDFNLTTEIGKNALRDVITDFSQIVGNRDQIDLNTIDANTAVATDQNFNFLAPIGSAFNGTAGTLIWSQLNPAGTVNDKTLIQGDTNGDNVADFQIELTGLISLTAADFIL